MRRRETIWLWQTEQIPAPEPDTPQPPPLTAPGPRDRSRHGQRRPQQAAGQDVLVRVLRADLPRGAQEEAPGLLGQLRRVFPEVLGEMEDNVCKRKIKV